MDDDDDDDNGTVLVAVNRRRLWLSCVEKGGIVVVVAADTAAAAVALLAIPHGCDTNNPLIIVVLSSLSLEYDTKITELSPATEERQMERRETKQKNTTTSLSNTKTYPLQSEFGFVFGAQNSPMDR